MKYSFSCPATCNYEIMVDAKNDDEALAKIVAEGALHSRKVHPYVLPMTEEQLKNMVRSGMLKARSAMRLLVGVLLVFWFALIFVLAVEGAFVRPPQAPPFPILLGATVPLVVFLAAYQGSEAFRAMVLGADLRLLTAIQAWRAGGLGFLALYAHGVLPGLFAWPAGLGDIAIGITAPWVALVLIRRPKFAATPHFVAWNLFGILDLVVAVSTGALSSGFVFGLAGKVTTAPMAQLPLVLIPAYFVPLFVMFHLAALFQARRSLLNQTKSLGR
jgi:hypothetical protein